MNNKFSGKKFMSKVPFILVGCAVAAVVIVGLSSRRVKHEYCWTQELASGEEHASVQMTPEEITKMLRNVLDPEIDINVVDLGLVYKVSVEGDAATITMTLTTPSCSYGPELITEVKKAVFKEKLRSLRLIITFDPPWTSDRIAPEAFKRLFTQARISK